MGESTTEPKGFCGLCGNPAYKCTCNTTTEPKLKFTDNGVGPCSDCKSDVNINSEGPATGTKILCPQCQGNYLHKDKVKEFIRLTQELVRSLATKEQIESNPLTKGIRNKIEELKLKDTLHGMEIKVDPNLKGNEFYLE